MSNLIKSTVLDVVKDTVESKREFIDYINNRGISKCIERTLVNVYKKQNITYNKRVIMWLGGGRSWDYGLECSIPEWKKMMTDVESFSFKSGNYDIFMMCNEPSAENFLCWIIEEFDKCIEDLNKIDPEVKYKFNFLRNISIKKGKCILTDTNTEFCTIFPCRSFMITAKSSRKSKIQLKDKQILYLEWYLSAPQVDLEMISNQMLQICQKSPIPTLRIDSLLMFNQFINTSRKEKGINVDMYRREFILNMLDKTQNINRTNAYLIVFKLFESVFKYIPTSFDIRRKLMLEIVNSAYDLEKNLSRLVILYFRNVINYFIDLIAKDLALDYSQDDVFIVIIGGDATRRYIFDITSESADIDCRVYISSKLYKKKNDIINRITKYAVILQNILETLKYDLIDRNYHAVKIISDNIRVSSMVVNDEPQLSVRVFDKHNKRKCSNLQGFVVDLISLDYSILNQIIIGDTSRNIKTKVAFLDIVIKENTAGLKYNDIVNKNTNVASKNFLRREIERMYSSNEDIISRYWSGKTNNDLTRYNLIMKNVNDSNIFDYHPELSSKEIPDDIRYRLEFAFNIAKNIQYAESIIDDDILDKKCRHYINYDYILDS